MTARRSSAGTYRARRNFRAAAAGSRTPLGSALTVCIGLSRIFKADGHTPSKVYRPQSWRDLVEALLTSRIAVRRARARRDLRQKSGRADHFSAARLAHVPRV